jgi:hypothetical protein
LPPVSRCCESNIMRASARAPLLAEIARDFRKRHRVQDPVRWHTALPGHLDAPVHVVKLGDRVRVRIDAEHAAELKGGLVPSPIKIEPPWMSVDLDHYVMLGAGTQHFLDLYFVAWPPQELAPGHVSDDGSMRMRDGPKQALRLRLAVQLEAPMDARDHEIEAFQHVVLIVERSVSQNVGLDAFEDPKILAEALIQAVSFPVLLRDLLNRETAGIVRGL